MQLFLICLRAFQLSKRFQHSHKKQKQILEVPAKLVFLCSYVMNQAIQEHIFLNKSKTRVLKTILWPMFLPFHGLFIPVFLCKDAVCQDQTLP